MESRVLFRIEPAMPSQLAAMNSFLSAEGMDGIGEDDLANCLSALSCAKGDLVGFIRLDFQEGSWYVNPVVVYPTWRGLGVGKALVEDARKAHPRLKLVSRGGTVGFYEGIGFKPMPWDEVAAVQRGECDSCPIRADCSPQPMRI